MAHITPTLGLIGPYNYISAIQALDISYGRMTPWVMFHSRRVWPRGPAVRRGCWEIRENQDLEFGLSFQGLGLRSRV